MTAAAPRDAAARDADALLLLEAAFPGDRLSPRAIRRLLCSPSARVRVIADDAGAVRGALVLLFRRGARAARIYSLAVDPVARGRGLAQTLIVDAERTAAARGCDRVRLEVRVDNLPALALYARQGYARVQRLTGYYEDGADGYRLEKRIASP